MAVIGIALDRPGLMGLSKGLRLRQYLRRFAAKLGVSYPILITDRAIAEKDGEMIVKDFGGVRGIPMTYLLARDGQVAQTILGYRKPAVIDQAVQHLLAR